jgi:hypothetical protein
VRFWRSRIANSPLWLPETAHEAAEQDAAEMYNPLWPTCAVCSAVQKRRINVVEYGVKDRGRLPKGDVYTAVYARCHGEEDVIRIDGFDWEEMAKSDGTPDHVARIAAIKALPFFAGGGERVIPAHVFRQFMSSVVDPALAKPDEAAE